MTQQHTPGPWAIRDCNRFEGGEPVTEIYSTVTDEVIANDQTYYPQAVKPQNARLIVPAVNAHEDLLEAAEQSLTAWLETQAAHGDVVARPFLIEQLRAAIAKATSPQAQ